MKILDYSAELFVAGRFADNDWSVYFPHRDKGFDFIAMKPDGNGGQLVRPVQVKGKYPNKAKKPRRPYGYIGKLNQRHTEMVLAIPFFNVKTPETPSHVAYIPNNLIKLNKRGCRCEPASFSKGVARPLKKYARFFDSVGLRLVDSPNWQHESLAE